VTEVRPYRADDRAAWDDLVARSRHAHFMFCRGYLEYHRDRFQDASLVILERGRPVALLPASRHGDEVRSHGGLTFGGLIYDDDAGGRATVERLEAVLDHLRDDGVRRLVYKPVPHIYHGVPAEEDLFALSRCGATLIRRDLSTTVRPDQPLAYSKGRRHAVARARDVVEVTESAAYGPFMEIETAALLARHGLRPVHTADELELLAGRFPDNIRLFTGAVGGELVGGVVVYETPWVAHAQYIGATDAGRAAGATDAIIDHLLGTVYASKRFFDFGISTYDEGRQLNEGLARNKESFGGRTVVYDHYALDL
jgi:hypothetical protein